MPAMRNQAFHQFGSRKVAQRIARRLGEQTWTVTVKMVGKKDVNRLIKGIFKAEKSSGKMSMVLD